jgi:hypothetical protein
VCVETTHGERRGETERETRKRSRETKERDDVGRGVLIRRVHRAERYEK